MGLPTVYFVAAAAGLVITPGVVNLATRFEWYDVPRDARRVHTRPVPRVGGFAVIAAAALGLAFAAATGLLDVSALHAPSVATGLIYAIALLFVVGLADDLYGITPLAKLLAQVAAALILYLHGFRLPPALLPFSPDEGFGAGLALAITVVWVVGISNAFNLIDGLDGLASGIAMVALASTVAVSATLQRWEVMVVGLAMLGALSGFLRYNFNPARIFLGDSGSLTVGMLLAVLTVHGLTDRTTAFLGIAPLFGLAVPVLDTALAIARRWLRGTSWAEGDRRHIHHQLLARGWSHIRAVVVLYVVATLVASFGLVIAYAPASSAPVLIVAAAAGAFGLFVWGLRYLNYHEFREAGRVLWAAPRRLRRVIRDQINAQDVARVLELADSLDEVNAILEDNAEHFGFLHMEVCRESQVRRDRPRLNGSGPGACKLDFPVGLHAGGDDPLVLRVWSRGPDSFRPFGAERVAGILAPIVSGWLARGEVVRLAEQIRHGELRAAHAVDSPRIEPGREFLAAHSGG